MKECWINCYGKYGGYGTSFNYREDAVYYGNCGAIKPKYRLHVKIKDKIGIENKYPYNFKDLIYSESRGRLMVFVIRLNVMTQLIFVKI